MSRAPRIGAELAPLHSAQTPNASEQEDHQDQQEDHQESLTPPTLGTLQLHHPRGSHVSVNRLAKGFIS